MTHTLTASPDQLVPGCEPGNGLTPAATDGPAGACLIGSAAAAARAAASVAFASAAGPDRSSAVASASTTRLSPENAVPTCGARRAPRPAARGGFVSAVCVCVCVLCCVVL